MKKHVMFGAMLSFLVLATGCVYPDSRFDSDPATGEATLSWAPPTARQDGSALEAVTGYRIYYGRDPKLLDHAIDVDGQITEYQIENLEPGEWYFAVAAISADGLESTPSSVMQKTIENPPGARVAKR